MFPALAGGFFTTIATWEALQSVCVVAISCNYKGEGLVEIREKVILFFPQGAEEAFQKLVPA